jgi:hypothetical protein
VPSRPGTWAAALSIGRAGGFLNGGQESRRRCPLRGGPLVYASTISKEEPMKFMLLIHQGSTPTPQTPDEWNRLSEDEQRAVYGAYQAVNATPGVTPGVGMSAPELATTVRVQDGKTLTTDGPFVAVKEALGGYLIYEAEDLDSAIELAARIPAASMGGAVEVRPVVEY